MNFRVRFCAIGLLALVVSCSRCSRSGSGGEGGAAGELTRLLPKEAEAVLVVPRLQQLGEKISVLQSKKVADFAAQLQNVGTGAELLNGLFAQLGVDPRSKESLESFGIDPAGGVGVAFLPGDFAYSVVGVKDEKRFEEKLAALAKSRLGAGVAGRRNEGGVEVRVFARAEGAAPALGYVFKQGYAVVAPGQSLPSMVKGLSLPVEASLQNASEYAAAVKRLPAGADLLLHIPSTSDRLERSVRAATLAIEMSATALTAVLDLTPAAPESLAFLQQKQPADLLGRLPPDAFLVARFSGDPASLGPVWSVATGPYLARAAQDAGFDFSTQMLANLKPGAVAALSLAPNLNLATGMPELDVRRTNPFDYLNLVALAEVKDPAVAISAVDAIATFAPKFGAKLQALPPAPGGVRIWQTQYAQGEGTHVALAQDKLVLASPMRRLERTLPTLAEPPKPSSFEQWVKPLADRPLVVVVDLQKLAGAVRDLPSSAWGLGGFAIKASTLRWLEGLSELRALVFTLRAAAAGGDAAQAELSLKLGEGGAGK